MLLLHYVKCLIVIALNTLLSPFNRYLVLQHGSASNDAKTFLSELDPVVFPAGYIRLGSDGDGGYVIPNDLDGVIACFSPGVSNNSDFEKALAHLGVRSWMCDASVNSPALTSELFYFEKKHLGMRTNSQMMRFSDWVSESGELCNAGDFLLQMDIEGSEYGVLLDSDDEILKRFRILVIEFHDFDMISGIYGNALVQSVFNKLSKNFSITYIHPNNTSPPIPRFSTSIPPLLEITFIRKDRITGINENDNSSKKLARKNQKFLPDVKVPLSWFSKDS